MRRYLDLMDRLLVEGISRIDRTGVGTRSIFGAQMRFDLSVKFPIVTTKKIHIRSVIYELLWFLRGDTNVKFLRHNGVHIWDEWADENGDLGPVYGHQWRSWPGKDGEAIDQLGNVVDQIKTNPYSRRHIVVAYNPAEVDDMALPPCHALFQFYVAEGRLSCQLYQRSADMFLGVPFNISSYALLTMMVAQQCGLKLGDFIWTGGDVHIYNNHIEQVNTQLQRIPYTLPTMEILRKPATLFDYNYEDFELVDYKFHPAIPAPIAV